MTEIKRITAKEFRELGLLQEVNRQFLHPMGFALEIVQEDDGSAEFGGVWDYRDDPDGMCFADPPEYGKANNVMRMQAAHTVQRRNKFGWDVQPPGVGVAEDGSTFTAENREG